MKEKFVHNHVSDHNHYKEDGKEYGHNLGTLQATLECQEAIHHWCRQKMHGQFIRWRRGEIESNWAEVVPRTHLGVVFQSHMKTAEQMPTPINPL